MDSVTVLTAIQGIATKTWRANGRHVSYRAGKRFAFAVEPVAGIRELAAVLERVSVDPRSLVIRGDPTTDAIGRAQVRRIKTPQDGEPAYFRAVPRRWVAVDIDSLPAPEGVEATSLDYS